MGVPTYFEMSFIPKLALYKLTFLDLYYVQGLDDWTQHCYGLDYDGYGLYTKVDAELSTRECSYGIIGAFLD